jgi:hypothetical protein
MLAATLACTGCRAFDETLLYEEDASRDAGANDAPSGDRAMPPPQDAGPGCALERPPPRPPGEDDGVDMGELVFVFHHLTLNQADGLWQTIGWDLDGLCTMVVADPVECVPASPSAPVTTDGEGGIDNALGQTLLSLLITGFPDIEMTLNGHEWGHGSLLIIVRGWNREDDDPSVDVAFTQTLVGTPPLADGGAPSIDPNDIVEGRFPARPTWDGNDWFWVRNASFFEGDLAQPRIRVDNAYIADRVLVMDFPDRVPIVFNDQEGAFVVQFTDGHLAGRIREDLSGFEWGEFGGRWPVADFLATLPLGGFCVGTEDYRRIERLTDLAADLRAVPGTGGAGAVCDAISGGIAGQGTRGRIAGVLDTHDDIVDKCATMSMDAGIADGGVGTD